jgi:hypothetical protein
MISVRGTLSHGGLRKGNPDRQVMTGFYRSPGIADHNILHGGHAVVVVSPLIAHRLSEEGWSKTEVKYYLYERARVPLERVQQYKQQRYGRKQEAGDPYYWPRWLDVEEPGVMVPVVRSPDHILVLVAGDLARSRSAYCPARPYNRPVTKKV